MREYEETVLEGSERMGIGETEKGRQEMETEEERRTEIGS